MTPECGRRTTSRSTRTTLRSCGRNSQLLAPFAGRHPRQLLEDSGELCGAFAAPVGLAEAAGREGEAVSQTEEFVLITTEAKLYRANRMTGKGFPELEPAAAAGDAFIVDYVRVYDIVE